MTKLSSVSVNSSSPYAVPEATELMEVTSDSNNGDLVRVLVEMYAELNTIEEAEARELFCICQKEGVDCGGDMIECSNADQCKDRWFHFKCIGMVEIPGETDDWFCDYCVMLRWGGAGHWYDYLQSLKSKPSAFDTVPASADLSLAMCEAGPSSKPTPKVMDLDSRNAEAGYSSTHTSHSRSLGMKDRLGSAHVDALSEPSRNPWKTNDLAQLSTAVSHVVANSQNRTVISWDRVAKRLQRYGIFRTRNSCKLAWLRYLKDRSKIDIGVKDRSGERMQVDLNKDRKKPDDPLIDEGAFNNEKSKARAGAEGMQEIDMEDAAMEQAVGEGNESDASTVILQRSEQLPRTRSAARKVSIVHV